MIDSPSVWQSYTSFHSAATIQKLLKNCYMNLEIDHAEQKGYQNCYPFIYYLEHGQSYYHLSTNAPLSIKPVLLFYGMVQLIKACLLTVNPDYPETTSVLAHGVTTRKRKKQSYEFLYDEVKIQKNGLYAHLSEKMFHVKQLEGEKHTMEALLRKIPELNRLFSITFQKCVSLNVFQPTAKVNEIPYELLDALHMTEDRFISFSKSAFLPSVKMVKKQDGIFMNVNGELNPNYCSPFLYHIREDAYYLPTKREDYHAAFPEVMIHYLLLYNLSMISRYETEWWSELFHSYASNDFPFIQQFLDVTSVKVPYLLLLFLMEKLK